MKVVGFDGVQRTWPIHNYKSKSNASSLHKAVRKFLKTMFPFDKISEELALLGSNKTSKNGLLYGDFFVPSQLLLVEAHGEQHYTFNSHFYKTQKEFNDALARDKIKKEWCEINNFIYVDLSHKETEDEWRAKIISAITT